MLCVIVLSVVLQSAIYANQTYQYQVGNGGIHLSINYSVSNETKWDKLWPNTKDFRLINYLFNTTDIHSIIRQIVTEFYWIFQHLNE
jgi:hypothetical protein